MGLFSPTQMAALTGGIIPPPPADYKLPSEFPPICEARRMALDFESSDPNIATHGPGWRRGAYPVGIAVAAEWKDGNIFSEYYPVAHRTGPNLDGTNVFNWLADNLSFYQGEIVGANLLYEADGLSYQGVYAPSAKWRDVQWAEALLDENAINYKMGTIAKKWLGESKVTDELKALYGSDYIQRFAEVHPGHARAYGLGDVLLPLRILDAQTNGTPQHEGLKKQRLEKLFQLESRLLPFLIYMRRLGVRIDLDAAARLGERLAGQRDEALREASKLVGFELNEENFGKPSTLALALERRGHKVPRTAPTDKAPQGNPSIKDAWLKRLDDPLGKLLVIANRCDKAKGTFVDGYITDYQINGRVHCEFHPLRKTDDLSSKNKSIGTVSGRFSSSHPNLQNIPARDDDMALFIGAMCRAMFVADEGMQWWSQDYSQIEYRFLIHYAVTKGCKGADVAQRMYKENPDTDFHEMVAKLVWAKQWQLVQHRLDAGEIGKDEAKKLWKAIRGPAKNLNFGLVYGMGEVKLAGELGELTPDGLPNDRAKEIMADYHAGAPFVRELSRKVTDYAQEKGFTTTILNRRRRFELWEPKYTEKGAPRPKALHFEDAKAMWGEKIKRSMTHKSLNSVIQGSAADLMKLAMVNLWEAGIFDAGNDINCSLTVHDELNGSFVPSARGNAALAEVKRIMETSMELEVPVLTSGNTGANWAEAK